MEHSPVPWNIDRVVGSDLLHISADDGSWVAGGITLDSPNAHIIAAAPNMLEALKELVKYLPPGKSIDSNRPGHYRKQGSDKSINTPSGQVK